METHFFTRRGLKLNALPSPVDPLRCFCMLLSQHPCFIRKQTLKEKRTGNKIVFRLKVCMNSSFNFTR